MSTKHVSDSPHTGGGAYVEGDVTAGTLIGRDQIVLIAGYSAEQLQVVLPQLREALADPRAALRADPTGERITVTAPRSPTITLSQQAAADLLPAAAREGDEQTYLAALAVNPRYGRWATQFVPLAGMLAEQEHPPGWMDIPPEFTELEVIGGGPQRQLRRVRLEDITDAVRRHPALALLGEPGSGKTTTLHRLLLDAARQRLTGQGGPLPVLLPLAEYRDYPSPHAFLQARWAQSLGALDLTAHLRRGDLLLLCDALNEMPFRDSRDYRDRVGAWRQFVKDWPGNRLVFTCRSRDYSEPLGLPQVEIERLDDPRIEDFLTRYLVPAQAQETWAKLRGLPLLDLARNPYYLTMLAWLVAQGGAWPASRAGLFRGFTDTLLEREQSRRHPDWPGKQPLLTALSVLAETMQAQGEGTRLPRGEALQRIPAQVDGPDGPVSLQPASVVRLGLAATLLDTELAASGEEQVRFYHQQVQEYLAAQALLRGFHTGKELSAHWRQPRLAWEMPDPGPLRDDEPLPPPPTTGWEEPTVLAAGMARDRDAFVEAVRRVNPVLAARCLAESGDRPAAEMVSAVQQDLLATLGDRRAHLRARIAAGEALGRLGDPRFETVYVDGWRVFLPPLVSVPGGRFRMGSGFWEVLWSRLRGLPIDDEWPRHAAELPAFQIGRYPVTNAEYACFLDAGGYEDERWWETPQAQAWRRGDLASGAVEDWVQQWRAMKADPSLMGRWGYSPQAIAQWEQVIALDERAFRCLDRGRRQLAPSPPSEPCGQFSCTRLSSR